MRTETASNFVETWVVIVTLSSSLSAVILQSLQSLIKVFAFVYDVVNFCDSDFQNVQTRYAGVQ
jgi:hypothetical protein